jgi:topoisomerase-4 subunit A
LVPFSAQLNRAIAKEDIEKLLEIRIKRISRYDIDKQAKEIKNIRRDIKKVTVELKDMTGYTIRYLEALIKKYGESYPRQTKISAFKEVLARKVALTNLTVGYDRAAGFFGHTIKAQGEGDIVFPCSEYDRLLLILSTGKYKVIPVPDKLFVGSDLAYAAVLKRDIVFNLIYREGSENHGYVKRFKTPKFILEKEYELFSPHKRSKILLLTTGADKHARVSLVPSQRAKSNIVAIDFNDYLIKNPSAKGRRVSTRVVRRVVESTERVRKEQANASLPGLE